MESTKECCHTEVKSRSISKCANKDISLRATHSAQYDKRDTLVASLPQYDNNGKSKYDNVIDCHANASAFARNDGGVWIGTRGLKYSAHNGSGGIFARDDENKILILTNNPFCLQWR